jgi:hypothetical protein
LPQLCVGADGRDLLGRLFLRNQIGSGAADGIKGNIQIFKYLGSLCLKIVPADMQVLKNERDRGDGDYHRHVSFTPQSRHRPAHLLRRLREKQQACRMEGLSDYKIILFHCEDAARVIAREHPQLTNSKMANWAKHLCQWALNRGDAIINTTMLTMEEAADELQRQLSAP